MWCRPTNMAQCCAGGFGILLFCTTYLQDGSAIVVCCHPDLNLFPVLRKLKAPDALFWASPNKFVFLYDLLGSRVLCLPVTNPGELSPLSLPNEAAAQRVRVWQGPPTHPTPGSAGA